jgi:DNA-binding transcriptional MerR regulator
VTSRSYLSIGDVLTLLREEFPDVTISKIRFLESQGLVNPERSPSGYRKFFEPDVERLRWVLRQQRENFLPLKVIRDRLADGDLSDVETGAPAGIATGNGRVHEPAHAASGADVAGRGRTVGVGSATVARTAEQSARADHEAMARILADASRRAARIPDGAGDDIFPGDAGAAVANPPNPSVPIAADRGENRTPRRPATIAPAQAAAHAPTSAPRAAHNTVPASATGAVPPAPASSGAVGRGGASGPVASAAGRGGTARPSGAGSHQKSVEPEAVVPSDGAAGTGGRSSAASRGRTAGARADRESSTTSMVTGASLTAEELCGASGLSEIELASLQGFGLIETVMVAGIPTFDEDALTVANLAAEFRKFGIEARHLRLYRNAVDREMGLIEQVIIPLLRQRNPESRQRALEGADELGALGQTMRATLMRTALRRHVGG